MKRFVIIDGNALVHRAYHALPRLITKDGELVNAVYGFASILIKALKELKPDYIAVAFDLAEPTFRHREYEKYKATRPKAPQELYDQLDRVRELVNVFNIPIYEKEGFEADDIIGSIVEQLTNKHKDVETIIVTGDLDTLQLVNKNTKVFTPKKSVNEAMIYDEEAIKERYGLKAEQMVDFKGLKGDPSDNIPGVPGIGEKTAIGLLKKFETIENLYKELKKNQAAINKKLADKLLQYEQQAFFSKYLSIIRKDVPLEISLNECSLKNYNYAKVANWFNEFQFYALLKRLPFSDNVPAVDMSSKTNFQQPLKLL